MTDEKYKHCPTHKIMCCAALAILLPLLLLAPAWAQTKTTQRPAADAEWKSVQDIFGFAGDLLPGNVIRFNMPRKDLHVTVAGTEVKPALALGAWAAFHRVGKNDAMIMGDLVLTDDEVTPVMKALRDGGVEVTALHNHLLGESPKILYIHMGG